MVQDGRETARLSPAEPLLTEAEATTPVEEQDEGGESFDRRRALTFARELVETVLLTLVIFVAVRTLVVNFRVDGESMRPNLQNGEYLLVNKAIYFHFDLNAAKNVLPGPDRRERDIVYLFHPPQRGDIIVFDPPVRSDKPYVKRVIGLPGDRIAVHRDNGKVYVNGTPLDEPYIDSPPQYSYPGFATGEGEYVVEAGKLFVLGDNRNNSSDSHIFGTVSLDSVIGKAAISYWPPQGIGFIPHQRYAQANGDK